MIDISLDMEIGTIRHGGDAGLSPMNSKPVPASIRFDKIKKIGKGAFGKVWLCDDTVDKCQVVAKEIETSNATERDEALQEARVLRKISHVNVIRYLDLHAAGHNMVIIYMEFADDGDLERKIGKRQPTWNYFKTSQVMQWLVQLVQAVAYLHSNGFIHRDIKVANIFLTKEGFVKLGDFGIAKLLQGSNRLRMSARMTRTPVGTPICMCPQVCSGKPYNQKADVWGLGCCLYEICALKPAFMARSMDQLMLRIKNGRRCREIPKHFGLELRSLIDDMLTIDQSRRPNMASILSRPMFATWLSGSPATLLAAGKTPQPYNKKNLLDPEEMRRQLAAKSAPNILSLDAAIRAERLLEKSSLFDVQGGAGAGCAVPDNSGSRMSRTPPPRKRQADILPPSRKAVDQVSKLEQRSKQNVESMPTPLEASGVGSDVSLVVQPVLNGGEPEQDTVCPSPPKKRTSRTPPGAKVLDCDKDQSLQPPAPKHRRSKSDGVDRAKLASWDSAVADASKKQKSPTVRRDTYVVESSSAGSNSDASRSPGVVQPVGVESHVVAKAQRHLAALDLRKGRSPAMRRKSDRVERSHLRPGDRIDVSGLRSKSQLTFQEWEALSPRNSPRPSPRGSPRVSPRSSPRSSPRDGMRQKLSPHESPPIHYLGQAGGSSHAEAPRSYLSRTPSFEGRRAELVPASNKLRDLSQFYQLKNYNQLRSMERRGGP